VAIGWCLPMALQLWLAELEHGSDITIMFYDSKEF
jgi:hypothetical protein